MARGGIWTPPCAIANFADRSSVLPMMGAHDAFPISSTESFQKAASPVSSPNASLQPGGRLGRDIMTRAWGTRAPRRTRFRGSNPSSRWHAAEGGRRSASTAGDARRSSVADIAAAGTCTSVIDCSLVRRHRALRGAGLLVVLVSSASLCRSHSSYAGASSKSDPARRRTSLALAKKAGPLSSRRCRGWGGRFNPEPFLQSQKPTPTLRRPAILLLGDTSRLHHEGVRRRWGVALGAFPGPGPPCTLPSFHLAGMSSQGSYAHADIGPPSATAEVIGRHQRARLVGKDEIVDLLRAFPSSR